MTMGSQGRTLELFFIDGKPDGMVAAGVFNWTGHVFKTPRTQLANALKRKEAGYTGVYILTGEKDGKPTAYIGESEDIGSRIKSHDTQRDWWTTAILVTSAANALNKAHVKYLEARLVEEAKSASNVKVENGNMPYRPSLSEADQANMEAFLSHLFIVLPALREDMFIRKTRPTTNATSSISAVSPVEFELTSKTLKLTATDRFSCDLQPNGGV